MLVEVNCETDFVARTEDFQRLAKELAMHIAAADPKFVRREDVPAEVLEKEKEIYRAQFADSGKPANVIDKIAEGKLESYYAQVCLHGAAVGARPERQHQADGGDAHRPRPERTSPCRDSFASSSANWRTRTSHGVRAGFVVSGAVFTEGGVRSWFDGRLRSLIVQGWWVLSRTHVRNRS